MFGEYKTTEDMNCSSSCQLKKKAENRREWRAGANQFNGVDQEESSETGTETD